ncbi:MAG: hypothetical protein NTU72_06080 [Fimbriimonadales bacterium]|nr:hypothetical protein [Fimbriimonadales bacterium]
MKYTTKLISSCALAATFGTLLSIAGTSFGMDGKGCNQGFQIACSPELCYITLGPLFNCCSTTPAGYCDRMCRTAQCFGGPDCNYSGVNYAAGSIMSGTCNGQQCE